MKKSLLALSAAFIALSSMAAIPQKPKGPVHVSYEKNMEIKGMGSLRPTTMTSMKKAPARINSAADVITSVDGELKDVQISGSGYMQFFGNLYYYENESVSSHVVYGDNNEVFIFNILPNGTTNSYVKGVRKGDKVEVELPQTLMWFEEDNVGLNLCLFEMLPFQDEDGNEDYWYFATDDTKMTFSVAEDGTMTADGLSEDKILGLAVSADNSWYAYGTWDLKITPFNEVPVTVPSDIEVSENAWFIPQEGYAQFINAAQGGEEMYLQGISSIVPEGWMKASIEYDDYTATVSIAQNQYMGVAFDSYFIYTKCAKIEETPNGYADYVLMPDDYVYQLVWDFEEETMKAKDPDVLLLFNVGNESADPLESVDDLLLARQDSYEGTPVNPSNLRFADFIVEEDYSQFFFDIPAVSTDGDYLLTNDLSYVVYVDGEPWTFDAEEYEIEDNLEEIPWSFSDYWICWGVENNIERETDFFIDGISTLGVQSIYKYNGKETRSEIITLDLDDPTSVADINAGKKVADVKYYDIAGREMANPAAGIAIKRVVYEDGTVASFKKVVR